MFGGRRIYPPVFLMSTQVKVPLHLGFWPDTPWKRVDADFFPIIPRINVFDFHKCSLEINTCYDHEQIRHISNENNWPPFDFSHVRQARNTSTSTNTSTRQWLALYENGICRPYDKKGHLTMASYHAVSGSRTLRRHSYTQGISSLKLILTLLCAIATILRIYRMVNYYT